ncbi:glycoside hydrolase family 88/105 protein [Colwellia sp. 20A7]|uniref:glycoside hydrolase family 88/105 protein n=1 Tax=Colwellia sp. 20A7 TaxID=2689569 RepID=UPI001357516B|nr:glycoside hydrolase family 88 protein [Colwellia sp. 20A7]
MYLKKIIFLSCTLMLFSCQSSNINQTATENSQVENISAEFSKPAVYQAMKKVIDWQLTRFNKETNLFEGYENDAYMSSTDADSHPQGWVYAAFHVGMSRWSSLAETQGEKKYIQLQHDIAKKNKYLFAPRVYNADDYAIGQLYLDLYEKYKDPEMLVPLKVIFELIMQNPATVDLDFEKVTQNFAHKESHMAEEFAGRSFPLAPCKSRWCWADSFFMGPPVWIHLSEVTGDKRYLEFANKEFWATANYLWDDKDDLFFRDSRFFDKREANGEKVIWARGVGWVAAGLARILESLPADHVDRPKYEDTFKRMMARLAGSQQDDGLWRPSVLAPESKPFKESSGTALITFAYASGINQGILDKQKYLPVISKAWAGLVDAVQPSGKLGWVQKIGYAPDSVSSEDTQVFAIGAFLLSGTEIYKLSSK